MSAELALVRDDNVNLLTDPGTYVAVACERAKAWLADALAHGDVEQIIEIRSQAEAVRIYTQQKELGRDAELSAAEIVRRAERGVHLALAKARDRGEVLRPGQTVRRSGHHVPDKDMVKSLADMGLERHELGNTSPLAKDVSDEQFEEATREARAEKDLSRANLIRKIKAAEGPAVPLSHRPEEIAELAGQRLSSRQMAERFGLTAQRVRKIARENGIEIPADRLIRNTHLIDPERVIRESVNTLQGVESSLNLLTSADYDEFSVEQMRDWLKATQEPARAIRNLVKELNVRVRNAARDEEG